MNSPQSNLLLDDNWIVTMTDEIEALPQTLADIADPYTVGWVEAELGRPCEPLAHYAKLGQIESYIIGWKDSTVALEEANDLVEARLDNEFIRTGGA